MLNRIIDQKDIWTTLKETSLPIVLYGTGDGADKILDVLESKSISIADIFVSDDFYRGQVFRGFSCSTLSMLEAKYSSFIILVSFGSHLSEVIDRIREIACRHTVLVPDVPVYGGTLFDSQYAKSHREELNQVYSLLEDGLSRELFCDVISYKLTGSLDTLLAHTYDLNRVLIDELAVDHLPQMHYLDLGAYRGDTIEQLLSITGNRYDSITALEPDAKTFKKLVKYADINLQKKHSINLINMGINETSGSLEMIYDKGRGTSASMLSSRSGKTVMIDMTTIDELFRKTGYEFSYIKMDVEGFEKAAILGGTGVISQYHPILNIALYHRSEDIFELPLLLHQIYPDYKFILRRAYCLPCWELNLYCK